MKNQERRYWLPVAVALCFCALALPMWAQATRTWVSGVGDDANPCSRTAPCKTFAGAISKTAAAGEIDVLDPGGFGAVTITKAITIAGANPGQHSSILVSGTNGIVIAAGSSDQVYLSDLEIIGIGTGIDGVRVLSSGRISINRCIINGFQRGISLEFSANASVEILDSTIYNNSGEGIAAVPSSGTPTVDVYIDGVHSYQNGGAAFLANSGTKATVRHSQFSQSLYGLDAEEAAGTTEVNLEDVLMTMNSYALVAGNGSTTRIGHCTITQNFVGIQPNGGTVQSYQNNQISANTFGSGGVVPISGGVQ